MPSTQAPAPQTNFNGYCVVMVLSVLFDNTHPPLSVDNMVIVTAMILQEGPPASLRTSLPTLRVDPVGDASSRS
ncbi:7e6121ba-e90a-4b77-9808-78103a298df4 [Thermothielavioides terrestris]|uniref:Uncharacterized protein n=2 Tax=Thermothielavioides terrestris TaxID=2587410 RepID=G2QS09_THETT|nr:uncharacterized protein THITE_154085 [Thermothielavioides terrestris NRRL 8126]AEO62596.1 hypothetical protein THITE_154085 [Thermothielavioides terrestris NRRL 8126]SPQ21907.1 7e6121ba-e90a-4b77-9808-78103a298df4 [Thermothielavioides terrestris]